MSEQMNEQRQASRKRPFAFSTREIMLMITIALVFGVVTIPIQLASTTLSVAAPLAQRLLSGVYLIAPLFGAFVFRRFGVAFLIPFLASLVWVGTTPFGISVLLLGLFLGLYCEVGMVLATRYRRFSSRRLVVAGIIAGACSFVISSLLFSLQNVAVWLAAGFLLMQMIGGGVGGFMAVQLANALQRTGILHNTPFGAVAIKES